MGRVEKVPEIKGAEHCFDPRQLSSVTKSLDTDPFQLLRYLVTTVKLNFGKTLGPNKSLSPILNFNQKCFILTLYSDKMICQNS